MEKTIELFSLRSSGFPFDACINILGILTEGHDIHMFKRCLDSRIGFGGPYVRIQIIFVSECNIQGTKSLSDRCCNRSLQQDTVFLKGCKCHIRNQLPVAFIFRFSDRKAFISKRCLCRLQNPYDRIHDFRSDTVSLKYCNRSHFICPPSLHIASHCRHISLPDA